MRQLEASEGARAAASSASNTRPLVLGCQAEWRSRGRINWPQRLHIAHTSRTPQAPTLRSDIPSADSHSPAFQSRYRRMPMASAKACQRRVALGPTFTLNKTQYASKAKAFAVSWSSVTVYALITFINHPTFTDKVTNTGAPQIIATPWMRAEVRGQGHLPCI